MKPATPEIINLTQSKLLEQALYAAKVLETGEVIATPTDTIYGIAALANTTKAIHKLYNIKGRDQSKPISICVANIEDIDRWGQVTVSTDLLRELLPGPVTLCFTRKKELNKELNPDSSIVGIRIPDHQFIREVCRRTQCPLALTSANVSKGKSTLAINEFSEIHGHLSCICDGGILGSTDQSRLGSTVVDLSTPGSYKIIRPGCAETETTLTLEKFGLAPL